MIIGTGNDITDIRRIEETLARFGSRFENKIFTPQEQKKAQSRAKSGIKVVAGTYAKRFAAKEACIKALGIRVPWREMEVVNLPTGAPTLGLHGRALARLQSITPPGMKPIIHLALSDEYPYAIANVIIETLRK